jgi:hypothetical protein
MPLTDAVLDDIEALFQQAATTPQEDQVAPLVWAAGEQLALAGVGVHELIALLRLGLAVQRANHEEMAGEIRRFTAELAEDRRSQRRDVTAEWIRQALTSP